ncbi:MAG: hypothetical protein LBI72_07775 [Flavobacteriaceae bacterium]|jgi:hypothetical protein|nr:hypothetical protein [Flavobacteriaceae bacterium]
MKRILPFIFLIILTTSCQWNVKSIPDEQMLLKEELGKIDWKSVDTYPSTATCDTLDTENSKRNCFFEIISSNIQTKLNADTLEGKFEGIDTLKVLVKVDAQSAVTFELYQFPDSLKERLPKVDSLLKAKDPLLPVILPAVKRGIPVKCEFVIPIVLKESNVKAVEP